MAKAAKQGGPPNLRVVEKIIKAAAPGDEALKRFSELFLSRADTSEFEGYSEEELAALVLSAWQFIATRKPGVPKIKVENPKSIKGSDGGITVVEILNDDMPFLVDSVMGEIQERGYEVKLVTHPVYSIRRDGKKIDIRGVLEGGDDGHGRESYIQVHLAQIEDAAERKELKEALSKVLETVRLVVEDWRPMLDRLDKAIAAYTASPPPVHVSVLTESVQFLKWLRDDNFTFLGMRAFAFVGGEKTGRLEPVPESGLGILRDPTVFVLRRGNELSHMTPEVRQFFLAPEPLIVTKANVRSVVHRRVHMDYIGVKLFGEKGEITGELRIVGLFTSTAYTRTTKRIPFLRQKVESVMERSGYPPNSHAGKALANVLETFPRDELFQIDVDTLYKTAIAIQALELRPRTRVFPRIDKFDRFVSVLVYVPRDRFSTSVRLRIGEHLAKTYKGRLSAFYLFFPEGPLVRIHYIIGRYEGETPVVDQEELERDVCALVQTWEDDLAAILREREPGSGKAKRYAGAFSIAYQEARTPEQAVADIEIFESLSEESPVAIRFLRSEDEREARTRVLIYHLSGAIPLSRRVPVLENLGFAVIDERSYRVARDEDDMNFALHDMILELAEGEEFDLEEHAARLQEAFLAVWRGEAGDDHYNRLVLHAGLD
ncbi:MAG: NAD-glutamate dehydrogenase, partial [Alphaproteobacteria bacterium]